jgi:hypothetical protein
LSIQVLAAGFASMQRSILLFCLVLSLVLSAGSVSGKRATPAASPVASPVAIDDCTGLEAYFLNLAGLITDDPALTTMRSVGFDALALGEEEAAAVVMDLELLIPAVEALAVPPAAEGYHVAYVAMLTWYRDLAEFRDPASHQLLINNDRHLFGDLGLGVRQGQVACGYERWNAAYDDAFPN